jgi:hypothetical protein
MGDNQDDLDLNAAPAPAVARFANAVDELLDALDAFRAGSR